MDLKRKAELVIWGKKNRKEYFVLFSKSGFTEEMKKVAEKKKALLFERDRLFKDGLYL